MLFEQWFTKVYQRKNLLDDQVEIDRRIDLIEELSQRTGLKIPRTIFEVEGEQLTYRQQRVQRASGVPTFGELRELSDSLDEMTKSGFVHGDLNRKNILLSDRGLVVIDLEPSLLQSVNGSKRFMVTRPYVACDDLVKEKITSATDKIAFYYYVRRVTGLLSSKEVVELANDLCLSDGLLNSRWQSDVIALSYEEILRGVFYKEI